LHCSTVVISVADKVDRLEACTVLPPPEAAELDAQQQAAAVAAPVALREAAEEVEAEQDAQPEPVAAAAPVALREVAEEVEAESDAQQAAEEGSVAQQQAVEVVPNAQLEAAKSDAQQEAVAGPQDAQRQEEVPAAQSGARQPEPWVESAETAAVRLWCRATSFLALAPA
jgi:hypothetical protein